MTDLRDVVMVSLRDQPDFDDLPEDRSFVRDRIRFLQVGGAIGILSSLVMTGVEFFRNDLFRVAPSLLFSVVAPLLLLWLRLRPEDLAKILTGFAGLILVQQIAGAFLSANEILMLIWYSVFPLTYFFLLGFRRALGWNAIAMVGITAGYLLFPALNRIPPVPLALFLSALLAYGVAVALAWYHYRVIHAYQIRLTHEAVLDGLTGALRRKAGLDQLSKLMAQSGRIPEMALSIALLDIDDFKSINDKDGHQSGDRVLSRVAETILSVVRKGDIFVRLGGEEFLLLLPGRSLAEADPLAENLRQRIERGVLRSDGTRVTVSIGLTQYRPGDSMADLLRRADHLMYIAKRGGKNSVCIREDAASDPAAPFPETEPAAPEGIRTLPGVSPAG